MVTSTTQPRNASPEPTPRPSVPESFGLRVRVVLNSTQQCLFGGDGPPVLTLIKIEAGFLTVDQIGLIPDAILKEGDWSRAVPEMDSGIFGQAVQGSGVVEAG